MDSPLAQNANPELQVFILETGTEALSAAYLHGALQVASRQQHKQTHRGVGRPLG